MSTFLAGTDVNVLKRLGMANHKGKTPKHLRASIRHDPVHPADYLKYRFLSACEDCTHFAEDSMDSKASIDAKESEVCTLGYNSKPHRRSVQVKSYELSGKMALCRFIEVD